MPKILQATFDPLQTFRYFISISFEILKFLRQIIIDSSMIFIALIEQKYIQYNSKKKKVYMTNIYDRSRLKLINSWHRHPEAYALICFDSSR